MVFSKTQSGFSMIQGLMLAAVIAGTSLLATRLLTDQKLTMRTAETRDQIEQLHNLVYSTLQHKDHCTETFFTIGGGTATLNMAVDAIKTSNGEAIIETHDGTPGSLSKVYMNGNVTVTSIEMQYPISQADHPQKDHEFYALAQIMYERNNTDPNVRTGKGYGGRGIKKSILIRLQRDQTLDPPPLSFCYAVKDSTAGEEGNIDLNKELCESLNHEGESTGTSFFEWHAESNTCRPKNNVCRNPGEINAGISSTGEAKCVLISEWMDTSKLIDSSSFDSQPQCPPNSTVSLDFSSGKVKLVCSPSSPPTCLPLGTMTNNPAACCVPSPPSCVCNCGGTLQTMCETCLDCTAMGCTYM